MKKFFVIIVLFALPLVAYLFFASGVNHFARLPVLTSQVYPLENLQSKESTEGTSFENHITILGFPGKEPLQYLTSAYHLAEKIYKPYHEFKDLHFVSVVPEGNEKEVHELKSKLAGVVDMKKWKFVSASPGEIKKLFASLGTNLELGEGLGTSRVFIIDKGGRLRGREKTESGTPLFGYDTSSIAVLNNIMDDDVKVILAEYRLELKKYNE